jgi:hypothetical protein
MGDEGSVSEGTANAMRVSERRLIRQGRTFRRRRSERRVDVEVEETHGDEGGWRSEV